jgi:cysteine desulfurase
MGHEEKEAFSAVRITVGKDTTQEEVDGFLEAFNAAVTQLRELSSLYTSKSGKLTADG